MTVSNPSAFPIVGSPDATGYEYGMTLRDYFAARCVSAVFRTVPDEPLEITAAKAAVVAYAIADVMLKAREREPTP